MAKSEKTCAACGRPAEGEHSIHRDGFGKGPEVDLCNSCGGFQLPTCEQIWRAIKERAHGSSKREEADEEANQ